MTNGWTYALCFALNGCGQQGRFSKQQLNYTLIINNEWWGAGVVICLKRGADLHMAQLMPLPLTVSCFSKIQIGFWYRLTQVVPDKGPLNGCVCGNKDTRTNCVNITKNENHTCAR